MKDRTESILAAPEGLAVLYLIAAGFWIYVSDRLLFLVIESEVGITFAQTLKGWAFVFGTALILYILLQRRQEIIDQAQTRLRRERNRYKVLVDASPVPIVSYDKEGHLRTWSRAAEEILGWSAEEVAGVPPPYVPEEKGEEFEALFQQVLQGETIHAVETYRQHKEGTCVPVSISAAPLVEESGEVVGVEVTIVDITDRKRYEDGLIEAKKEAEEMSRLKSAFLANMSHEIRTPLTSILGFADLIVDMVEGEAREFAEHIRRGGVRLKRMLTSVLKLTEFESGDVELEASSVNVAEIVMETAQLYKAKAEEKELSFQIAVPEAPVFAWVNASALQQVVTNLISNAVKFTAQGGVTVAVESSGSGATIRVSDSGIGIDEAFLSEAFEAFKQESEGLAREYEGSGLGLHIARRFVERMEGTIHLESEKDKGTVATVCLPAQPSASGRLPKGGDDNL